MYCRYSFAHQDSFELTRFSTDSNPSPPLRDVVLSSTDTIKLSFQVQDAETSQPVQPQQAVVSWQPVDEREKREHGRHFAAVVKVRNNGKARWELVSFYHLVT
jgi:hypothetical protein